MFEDIAAATAKQFGFNLHKKFCISTSLTSKQCNFDPSPGAVHTEDNFGYYMTFSPKFRCTDPGRESTTNHWFGGFVVY